MGDSESSTKTDEEIVALIISGDSELFAELIRRYQKPLTIYANRLVMNEQSAEDVVQNSFIKAYQNLRSFNLKRKFSSWIYRITHNEAVNHIRKNRREITVSDEGWFDTKPSNYKNIQEVLENDYDKAALRSAISALPLKYREPILLYTMDGKSYEEISEILRIPKATVGTRINRAKIMIRKSLEKGDDDD